MTHPRKHVDDLAAEGTERELVSQLTPDRDTRLRNEQRANDLRKRINTLNERIAKLMRDQPKK